MIYQYRCVNCGGNMVKLLNAVPVHYKGSGFYSTDYNKKDK